MNKIERLIEKLCPKGAEWKTLGELGEFFSGLSGKSKDDFKDGNAKFITYMNVYSNLALRTDVPDRVKVAVGEKQNTLEKGDVLFTGSSETPDECGMSSVVTVDVTEPLYLNSFCFGFRLADKKLFNPDFLKHLLRSTNIRHQITRTASGVTRFNVSKAKMAKVSLPVPPLEVQSEIVQILDNFAKLTAELTAELAKRKKQYEHYRDTLLSGDWPRVKIKDVISESFWLMPATPKYIEKGVPYITSKNVCNGDIDFSSVKYISENDYRQISANRYLKQGDLLITMIGTIGEAAFVGEYTKFYGQNIYTVRFDTEKMIGRYYYYYLTSERIKEGLITRKNASSQGYIKAGSITDMEIPLPPLAEQERIVGILDKFDKLVNSLTEGLPAEIAAREKQYAYYRDKLLSFGKGEK